MKVRSSNLLPAAVMIVAVLAILTSLLRIWQVNRFNDYYRDSFVLSGDSMGDVDVSQFGQWASFPTDTRGQRTTDPSGGDTLSLSDIQREAKASLGDDADQSLDVTFSPWGSDAEIARTFTRGEYETLRLDFELYERGIFCSPDLAAPVWTGQTLFALIAGILLTGWSIVLFVLRFRDTKKREEDS